MLGTFARWLAGDRGGTALEYALIVGVVALAVVGAAIALGAVVDDPFAAAVACFGDFDTCTN